MLPFWRNAILIAIRSLKIYKCTSEYFYFYTLCFRPGGRRAGTKYGTKYGTNYELVTSIVAQQKQNIARMRIRIRWRIDGSIQIHQIFLLVLWRPHSPKLTKNTNASDILVSDQKTIADSPQRTFYHTSEKFCCEQRRSNDSNAFHSDGHVSSPVSMWLPNTTKTKLVKATRRESQF